MRISRPLLYLTYCACLSPTALGATPAHAQPQSNAAAPVNDEEALREHVASLLEQGIEKPVSSQVFDALGTPGALALIATFENESAQRHVRLRALSMLGAIRAPAAHAYLLALAGARPQQKARLGALHPARSTTALRRLLEALERSPSAESTRVARSHLAHQDVLVRRSAVRLLARDNSESATRALSEHMGVESSATVRKALGAALKDRSAPPANHPPRAPKSDSPPR